MKYITIISLVLVFVASLFFLIKVGKMPKDKMMNEGQGQGWPLQTNVALPEGRFSISPQFSTVTWSAGKPGIVGYIDKGSFAISQGEFVVTTTVLTGFVELDMTQVSVSSHGGGKISNVSLLEQHLKSEDFFDVQTYPSAKFDNITAVKQEDGAYLVTGNLTIKNITHEVTFPATVGLTAEGALQLDANLVIDRTKWNITFGSASFFTNLAENAVGDEVEIALHLVAR